MLTIRDYDRGTIRFWTTFVNDPDLIHEIARVREGEPIVVSGPFSFRIAATTYGPEIQYSVTANSIADAGRRKPRIRRAPREQRARKERSAARVEGHEADEAAAKMAPGDPNDALPF